MYFQYFYMVLLTLPLLINSYPAEANEKTISLGDVTMDNDLAASDSSSLSLHKRSGSGSAEYALHIKQGFLSSLGHASASIVSSSSGGSSGGGYGNSHHVRKIKQFDKLLI